MGQTANVHSVEAIKDFKLSLISFAEDARNALSSADMEVRRTRDWLSRDQLSYWRAQVKRREEEVNTAKSDLARRKMMQTAKNSVSDTDQKEALRLALRRLLEAQEKVEKVVKMIPYLEHAIAEYQSCSQPLGDTLTGQFMNSVALVERMIKALEAYLALTAPSAPALAPEGGSSNSSSGSGKSAKVTSALANSDDASAPASKTDASAPEETKQVQSNSASHLKTPEGVTT